MPSVHMEGYRRAVDLIRRCGTPDGFVASPTDSANYRRIWGRDGAILGLAALATEDQDLVETCRLTLETLARYQGWSAAAAAIGHHAMEGRPPFRIDADES